MIVRTLAFLAIFKVVLCWPTPVFKLPDLNELPEVHELSESAARQLSSLRSSPDPGVPSRAAGPTLAPLEVGGRGEAIPSLAGQQRRGRRRKYFDEEPPPGKRPEERQGKNYTQAELDAMPESERALILRMRRNTAAWRQKKSGAQQQPPTDEVKDLGGQASSPANAAFRELAKRQRRFWRRQRLNKNPKAELPPELVFKDPEYRDNSHPRVLELAAAYHSSLRRAAAGKIRRAKRATVGSGQLEPGPSAPASASTSE